MTPEYLLAAVNIVIFNLKIADSRYVPSTQPYPVQPPSPALAPSCYPQAATAYYLPVPPSAPKITVLNPGTYPSQPASGHPVNFGQSSPMIPAQPGCSPPSAHANLPIQPVYWSPAQPSPTLAPPVPLASSPTFPPWPAQPYLPPPGTPPISPPQGYLPQSVSQPSPVLPTVAAPPVYIPKPASSLPTLPSSPECSPAPPTLAAPAVCPTPTKPPNLPVLPEFKRQTSGLVPPPEEICIIEEPLFLPPPSPGPVKARADIYAPESNLRFDVLRGFLISLGI